MEEERVKCPLCRAAVSHRVGVAFPQLFNCEIMGLIYGVWCRLKSFAGRERSLSRASGIE